MKIEDLEVGTPIIVMGELKTTVVKIENGLIWFYGKSEETGEEKLYNENIYAIEIDESRIMSLVPGDCGVKREKDPPIVKTVIQYRTPDEPLILCEYPLMYEAFNVKLVIDGKTYGIDTVDDLIDEQGNLTRTILFYPR